MNDRAGNTLASARKVADFATNPLTLKDALNPTDLDDLYTFSSGGGSLNLKFSGSVAAELFTVKNRKAFKKISKIEFSKLKRQDIRSALSRVARSSNAGVPQISLAELPTGSYFLRVRSPNPKTKYTVEFSSPAAPTAPNPSLGTPLFNGVGLPKDQGWIDFNQIPTFVSSALLPFVPSSVRPFVSSTAKTVEQTPGATGVTFKTDQGIVSTTNLNQGYAGYSNYTVSLSTLSTVKVNPAFPTLDRNSGYSLSFKLAVNSETSDPNRAGFSITLISEDAKGIELGFKGDRIFAQSDTFTEAETAAFATNALTDYKLSVQGDGYELFANNASLLKGNLRSYVFDNLNSNPPLPTNPYAFPSLLFLGDNTDQGRADVTLGAIALSSTALLPG
jgi:hypothetical protein